MADDAFLKQKDSDHSFFLLLFFFFTKWNSQTGIMNRREKTTIKKQTDVKRPTWNIPSQNPNESTNLPTVCKNHKHSVTSYVQVVS